MTCKLTQSDIKIKDDWKDVDRGIDHVTLIIRLDGEREEIECLAKQLLSNQELREEIEKFIVNLDEEGFGEISQSSIKLRLQSMIRSLEK